MKHVETQVDMTVRLRVASMPLCFSRNKWSRTEISYGLQLKTSQL